MIRLAIVEDEDLYANQLYEYIQKFEQETDETFQIIRFRDGDEIAEEYTGEYDIILMDIEMQFMDGMTAAEKIREFDEDVVIMFITNMTNYAIRGYQVDALDYVVKPVEYFSFCKKLERALSKVEKKKAPTITIKIQSGAMKLKTNDIYYIESEGHNLHYVTKKGTYKCRAKIQSAEEDLAQYGFFRSNKSYLVNMQYVEGVSDGCCIVNGDKLLISRARKKDFMVAMTDYISNR